MSAGAPGADEPAARFLALWSELETIGRRPDGGYDRFSWTEEDLALRAWFRAAAADRAMGVEQDRNGNLWAWWGDPPTAPTLSSASDRRAVAVGSHLDSVPRGGAFDGPLGVASAFLAVDLLRAQHGDVPPRPLAVVAFAEEEGARFGVACLGSRLMTGAQDPESARRLTDRDGTTLAAAMAAAGALPGGLGADEERLAGLECYVELHVEQGRALAGRGAAVGIGRGIWPHGRWRIRLEGEPDHAGTAALGSRRDPMLPFAAAVTAARDAAGEHGGLATVGRVEAVPNATNAVAARVDAWLDARAPDEDTLFAIVDAVVTRTKEAAKASWVAVQVVEESRSAAVAFDSELRRHIAAVLGQPPELATGAGHDAGILAARLPTAMLFVRNPTGVSHSPSEHAELEDCLAGVRALAAVLDSLLLHRA